MNQDNSVINALKRLERAGAENSETTRKLIEATRVLSEAVAARIKSDYMELPAFYRCRFHGEDTCWLESSEGTMGWSSLSANCDRDMALRFAGNIAQGWLNEVVQLLEKRKQEDQEATTSLEAATQELPARLPVQEF